jgi:hypothetical protein
VHLASQMLTLLKVAVVASKADTYSYSTKALETKRLLGDAISLGVAIALISALDSLLLLVM